MDQENQKSNKDKILLERGRALTEFAWIEHLMILFISRCYVGKEGNFNFEKEIFGDKFFSFGLLQNIFNRALKKYFPTEDFPSKELDSLRDDRNLIAHAMLGSKLPQDSFCFITHGEFHPVFEVLRRYWKSAFIVTPFLIKMLKDYFELELPLTPDKDPTPLPFSLD